MDTDSGGSGTAPAPHGRVSSRASSALAALSILVILLYLIWRFIWQCRKHGTRSNSTGGTVSPPTSSARPPSPSCPSRDVTAAYGAGEAARRTPRTAPTSSPLSVLVRVAAARFGAEKVDCAVCLAELGDGDAEDATRLVPGCGHGFHAECIEAWFRVNSTCPLCRAAVAAAAAGQGAGEAPRYDSSV
ncbi:E3 ubiquitin-protein ligase EL5-like [Miscanthus floridulus]|uniref:E3 ubiquitin-protein ligase EL5-like n=1 Tax=Miscanthus floridulus TaxID=154761 RepID=UPI003459D3E4